MSAMMDGMYHPQNMYRPAVEEIEVEEDETEYQFVQIELTDGDIKKFYCEDMDWSDDDMYEFNEVIRNNSGHIEEVTEYHIFKKFVRSISILNTNTNPYMPEIEARRLREEQREQEQAQPTVDHFEDI